MVAPDNGSRKFATTRNACKLCTPLGASLAFRGIENCVPILHGSQGCSTYIRRYLISHFKEPVDIASSNFTEESAIFGGGTNLKTALDNVIRQYNPSVVGVATTCLSETIGDDVDRLVREYLAERSGQNLPPVVSVSTPSYSGTHREGFFRAVKGVLDVSAEPGVTNGRVNLIPGMVSPADLRSLKETLAAFGVPFTLLPDWSETMDGGTWDEYRKIPEGGTTLADIAAAGSANATFEFSGANADRESPAELLRERFGIASYRMNWPVGVIATDHFIRTLSEVTGHEVPNSFEQERARLVDSYIDAHKHLAGVRALVYGDADFVAAAAGFLDEIGVTPAWLATGERNGTLVRALDGMLPNSRSQSRILEDIDFATLQDLGWDDRPDLLVGNSRGYGLSRRLEIPLVRAGFPIHDRVGGARIRMLGYAGTQELFDRVVNALIGAKQDHSPVGWSYM